MIGHMSKILLHQITTLWIVILLLLVACNTSVQPNTQPTGFNDTTASVDSAVILPQDEFTSTPMTTFTSTVTPQATKTLEILIEIPTPTIYPTPTFTATLSAQEQEALVVDLLHNNAGCKLPCWWGFTPRKTNWTTAQNRISNLGLSLSSYPSSEGEIFGTGFYLTEHSFSVGSTIFVQNDVIHVIQAHAETTPGPWQRIYGDPFYLEAMQPYLLSSMLSTYGKPEQVLLYVLDTRDPVLSDYFMLLFYPQTGILAQYEGQSEEGNGVLRLCPRTAVISMWLWSPDEKMTLADVFSFEVYTSKDVQMKFLDRFLPLEDAALISIEDFHTQFDSQQKSCLETPKSLWNR